MLVEGFDNGGSEEADTSIPSNWAKSSSSVSFLDMFTMTCKIQSTMGLFEVENCARGAKNDTRMRNRSKLT